MYDAYRVRYKVTHLPVYQQCIRYIRTKWPYVLHHVLLFIFGYTVVVVRIINLIKLRLSG